MPCHAAVFYNGAVVVCVLLLLLLLLLFCCCVCGIKKVAVANVGSPVRSVVGDYIDFTVAFGWVCRIRMHARLAFLFGLNSQLSQAVLGKYKGQGEAGAAAASSLHVANYKY